MPRTKDDASHDATNEPEVPVIFGEPDEPATAGDVHRRAVEAAERVSNEFPDDPVERRQLINESNAALAAWFGLVAGVMRGRGDTEAAAFWEHRVAERTDAMVAREVAWPPQPHRHRQRTDSVLDQLRANAR